MRKIIITLFLVAFSAFYMKAQDIQAITNGFPIEIQNVPYQVSIEIRRDGRVYNCGGSIINNRYVLTAAHCVKGKSTSNITVKVGLSLRNNHGSNVQTFNVLNMATHPNYNANTFDFDVAVIEINGTFTFNNFVQPIELISSRTLSAETVGNQVRVSGWGWTTPNGDNPSNQLQAVDVPIISNQIADTQLDIAFSNLNPPEIHPELTQRMISTGAVGMNRSGACHGDSGGPLVFKQTGKKDIQIGVVSWGVKRCVGGQNSPSIYARLSKLVGWVNGQVLQIKGSGLVCFNTTKIYTLQDVPSSITTTWQVSNNVSILSKNNTSITVRALNSSSTGNGWVKAILSNGVVLKEGFEVGTPQSSLMAFNRYASYDFQSFRWNLLGAYYNGVLTLDKYQWEWQVPSSTLRHSSSYHSYINFRPTVSRSTRIYIKTRASNECGCSDWHGQWFNVVYRNNDPCRDSTGNPCADDIIEY